MKKNLILFFIALLAIVAKAHTARAQTQTPPVDTSEVFVAVEKPATFPGGLKKFQKYLRKNSKYPITTSDGQSSHVLVIFIVQKDGSLTDIKIARSVNPEIDLEAVRLVKASEPWIPGEQNGRKVKQQSLAVIYFEQK